MSDQPLSVTTQLHLAKPPAEVYEAIVNPGQMSGYFISSGDGRLDEGRPVTWTWLDYGAEAEVTPEEVDPGRVIVFRWRAGTRESRVRFELEPTDDGTLVKVTEGEWPRDDAGIARALEQMQGWMNMLCCLKAWLEYGINLRK